MKIYFRCCEKQQSVSGVQRWSEIPKNVMIKKCWKSIYDGIDANDEVFILHDEVSEDTLSFIEKYSYDNTTFLEVPKHEIQDRLHTFKMLEFLKPNYNLVILMIYTTLLKMITFTHQTQFRL